MGSLSVIVLALVPVAFVILLGFLATAAASWPRSRSTSAYPHCCLRRPRR